MSGRVLSLDGLQSIPDQECRINIILQLRLLLYLVSTHCLLWAVFLIEHLPFLWLHSFNIGSVLPSAPIRSTEFNPPPLNLRRFTSDSTLPLGLLRLHRIKEVLLSEFPLRHTILFNETKLEPSPVHRTIYVGLSRLSIIKYKERIEISLKYVNKLQVCRYNHLANSQKWLEIWESNPWIEVRLIMTVLWFYF